jgi:hypothetical protein
MGGKITYMRILFPLWDKKCIEGLKPENTSGSEQPLLYNPHGHTCCVISGGSGKYSHASQNGTGWMQTLVF